MALICRVSFCKCPTGLILRIFNNGTFLQKYLKSSTSKVTGKADNPPLKYTTNRASKLEISDTIGLKEENLDPTKRISRLIIIVSSIIFLVYFCILREENDIDEKLKGGEDETIQLPELMKLKMDLAYCTKMNLPTDAIKARIEELEKGKKYKSPFLK